MDAVDLAGAAAACLDIPLAATAIVYPVNLVGPAFARDGQELARGL